ncbi:MAG TPA: hypothetical protein VIC08_13855 [Cellvibrionaceae bacterium]
MKHPKTITSLLTLCLSAASWANADTPQLYLNQNLGFNVPGYNYAQSEYPCDLDKVLVQSIIDRGAAQKLQIEAAGTADKLQNASIPVLAIDIEALVLGEEQFGTRSRSNLPSVKVTTALIHEDLPEGFVTATHSCAIATLNQLTPSSNVLDMGTYGHTVCSATHKCLNDLGKDIVQWVKPQLR